MKLGDVGYDSLVVTVDNIAPTVEAGPDEKVQPGEPISFSGGITDPGADDTWTIEWDLGDGTFINDTLTFNYAYEDPGNYTITLTVTDDDSGVGDAVLNLIGQLCPFRLSEIADRSVRPTEEGGPAQRDRTPVLRLDPTQTLP